MLISELAEQVGLHPETIRRLERRGVVQSKRDRNGWRVYGPESVAVLRQLYQRMDVPIRGGERPGDFGDAMSVSN